ncbi:hypothetical protein DB35_02480 [Streptomyces abyssalis]|uniref:Type A2 lantipeptide n=1 Tax=Streptomyces abyssalis TaxID=933944 RepID=A0A1E7JPH3_9ACTN|nr:hypothetical protein [Streptomyces abyssalis]OEU90187.1 hypothetical protein AN215_11630 [Streptomyces abyssalis]OEU94921.1 hypothetical protein DB35_02480 [Streptomyces abyssalis]OEV30287.1 hypothetical protein AN219_11685 [Streptomyces nanshensis]
MRDISRIETAELSDADLDNVSGGVSATVGGGIADVAVTPGPGGVAANVDVVGVNGTVNAGVPAVEGASGIVG